MKTYCVKCRKNTENIDPKVVRTNMVRTHIGAKGLLSNLGIKTHLSKILLLNVLF